MNTYVKFLLMCMNSLDMLKTILYISDQNLFTVEDEFQSKMYFNDFSV